MVKSCPDCQTTHDDTIGACPHQTEPSATDGEDRLLGKVVRDRYRISSRLGRGAMGVVYKAEQLADGKQVALKVLHTHLLSDPESIKRFQHEAGAAKNLMHPHIVHIFDFGMIPSGQPYIAMEFLEGTTLADLIRQKGSYTLAEALPIIRQTCEALAEAHSHGVMHRDIKPANIMLVNRFGQADHVVVLDFSIAKVIQRVSDRHTPAAGLVLGSPAYMSPERFQGQGGDFRADIYSLGIIMFQMLAGRTPFKSGALYTLMNDHASTPPPRVQDINPQADISESMERTIARALMKKVADRHANMKQLLAEINNIYHEGTAALHLGAAATGGISSEPPLPCPSLRRTQELPSASASGPSASTRSEPVFFEVNPGLTPTPARPSPTAMARPGTVDEPLPPLPSDLFSSGKWDKGSASNSSQQRPTIRPPEATVRFPLEIAVIVITVIASGTIYYTLTADDRQASKIDALLKRDDLKAAMSMLSSWHPRQQDAVQSERYGQDCLSLGKALLRKKELALAASVLSMVPSSSKAYSQARALAKQCLKQRSEGE